jgi:hypothetical protein
MGGISGALPETPPVLTCLARSTSVTRTLMTLREAVRADAPFLVDLWHDTLRRVDRHEQLGDL